MYDEFTKNMNIKMKDVTIEHWRDIVKGVYCARRKTLSVWGAGTEEYKREQMNLALTLANDLISGNPIHTTESTLGTYQKDMSENPFTIITMVFTVGWNDNKMNPIDITYVIKLGYMYGKTYIHNEELSFGFKKEKIELINKLETMLNEDEYNYQTEGFDPFESENPRIAIRPHIRIEPDNINKDLLKVVLKSVPLLKKKNIYLSSFLEDSLNTIYTEIVEGGFLC